MWCWKANWVRGSIEKSLSLPFRRQMMAPLWRSILYAAQVWRPDTAAIGVHVDGVDVEEVIGTSVRRDREVGLAQRHVSVSVPFEERLPSRYRFLGAMSRAACRGWVHPPKSGPLP